MSYVIAIVGLGAACVGWFVVQRWAGQGVAASDGCGDCNSCDPEPRGRR